MKLKVFFNQNDQRKELYKLRYFKKLSRTLVLLWLTIHVQKVDPHNSKWLYYSRMRHSRQPNTGDYNCQEKRRSFARIVSKVHPFEPKIIVQTHLSRRNLITPPRNRRPRGLLLRPSVKNFQGGLLLCPAYFHYF